MGGQQNTKQDSDGANIPSVSQRRHRMLNTIEHQAMAWVDNVRLLDEEIAYLTAATATAAVTQRLASHRRTRERVLANLTEVLKKGAALRAELGLPPHPMLAVSQQLDAAAILGPDPAHPGTSSEDPAG
jgi:hypothetical protein